MEKTLNSKITEKLVMKAIEQGAQSPTAVAKMLGYKSGSSGVIKAILKVVPDLRLKLEALNDVDKTGKTDKADVADNAEVLVKSITASTTEIQIPDCVPFRKSCGYAIVWSILYTHRAKGLTKKELIAEYMASSGKAELNAGYDVQVVCSPRKDGGCNRSASKASQSYWVERTGDLLKLHLVDSKS